MKTLLFHSLVLCSLVFPGICAKAATTLPMDGVGPKITLTIELGRRSKGCARIGVCRVSLEEISRQAPIGENTATGTAWIENGRLKIAFDYASMSSATFQTHFGSGYFQLEEDYVLPADVAAALGVRAYTIKTGKYTVPESADGNNAVPVSF